MTRTKVAGETYLHSFAGSTISPIGTGETGETGEIGEIGGNI